MAKKVEEPVLDEIKQEVEPVLDEIKQEVEPVKQEIISDETIVDVMPSYSEVESEEDKIKKYEEFLTKYKIDLEREADTADTSFHFASNEVLLELAKTYSDIPYSYNVKVADVLYNELIRRNLVKEAEKLKESLNKSTWYVKPWMRF